jgi:hypothetical protein
MPESQKLRVELEIMRSRSTLCSPDMLILGNYMSEQQLDRIERKINRLGNLIIVGMLVLTVVVGAEIPTVTAWLLEYRWIELGVVGAVAVSLLVARHPFRP